MMLSLMTLFMLIAICHIFACCFSMLFAAFSLSFDFACRLMLITLDAAYAAYFRHEMLLC